MLLKRNTETVEASALPLDSIYAKTIVESDGSVHFGLDLYSHSIIVGVVASLLVELFPKQIRDRVFPLGVSLVAACLRYRKGKPDVHEKALSGRPW